jgi:hypothetical protein
MPAQSAPCPSCLQRSPPPGSPAPPPSQSSTRPPALQPASQSPYRPRPKHRTPREPAPANDTCPLPQHANPLLAHRHGQILQPMLLALHLARSQQLSSLCERHTRRHRQLLQVRTHHRRARILPKVRSLRVTSTGTPPPSPPQSPPHTTPPSPRPSHNPTAPPRAPSPPTAPQARAAAAGPPPRRVLALNIQPQQLLLPPHNPRLRNRRQLRRHHPHRIDPAASTSAANSSLSLSSPQNPASTAWHPNPARFIATFAAPPAAHSAAHAAIPAQEPPAKSVPPRPICSGRASNPQPPVPSGAQTHLPTIPEPHVSPAASSSQFSPTIIALRVVLRCPFSDALLLRTAN